MWSLQSILSLARQWGEFKVTEANISMLDFTRAMDEGRVYEAFGAGTAAVVSPIKRIQFRGKVSFPPPHESRRLFHRKWRGSCVVLQRHDRRRVHGCHRFVKPGRPVV